MLCSEDRCLFGRGPSWVASVPPSSGLFHKSLLASSKMHCSLLYRGLPMLVAETQGCFACEGAQYAETKGSSGVQKVKSHDLGCGNNRRDRVWLARRLLTCQLLPNPPMALYPTRQPSNYLLWFTGCCSLLHPSSACRNCSSQEVFLASPGSLERQVQIIP